MPNTLYRLAGSANDSTTARGPLLGLAYYSAGGRYDGGDWWLHTCFADSVDKATAPGERLAEASDADEPVGLVRQRHRPEPWLPIEVGEGVEDPPLLPAH